MSITRDRCKPSATNNGVIFTVTICAFFVLPFVAILTVGIFSGFDYEISMDESGYMVPIKDALPWFGCWFVIGLLILGFSTLRLGRKSDDLQFNKRES